MLVDEIETLGVWGGPPLLEIYGGYPAAEDWTPDWSPSAATLYDEDEWTIKRDCMWNGSGAPLVEPNLYSAGQSVLKPRLWQTRSAPTGAFSPSRWADPNIIMPRRRVWITAPPPPLPADCAPHTPPLSDDEEAKSPNTAVLQDLCDIIDQEELPPDLFDELYSSDSDELDELASYMREDGAAAEYKDIYDAIEKHEAVEEEWGDEDECEEDDIKPDIEELKPSIEDVKPSIEDLRRRQREEQERIAFYAASDHSYHKGVSMAVDTTSLGIDTPSDSEEEEIDVVSVEHFSALPTNPSSNQRQRIQRTMQSRFPQGAKTVRTLMPVRPARAARAAAAAPAPRKPARQPYRRTKGNNARPNNRRRSRAHSSDSSTESEPSDKRNLHNNMERQRRIDLKNLFDGVRDCLPELKRKTRAAKVLILRVACTAVRALTIKNNERMREMKKLMREQEVLKDRLRQLRRQAAYAARRLQ